VDDVAVWSLSCFYVRKGYRRRDVTSALITAALQAAKPGSRRFSGGCRRVRSCATISRRSLRRAFVGTSDIDGQAYKRTYGAVGGSGLSTVATLWARNRVTEPAACAEPRLQTIAMRAAR